MYAHLQKASLPNTIKNIEEVLQVPTFIFFRNGKEVGRHVGSTRGDLIGQILQQQKALGLTPPTLQGKGVVEEVSSSAAHTEE